MLKFFLAITTALLFTGCLPPLTWRHYHNYEPDKSWCLDMPKVVIFPVFDSSNHCLEWNIAREVNLAIREKVLRDQNLFLLDEDYTFQSVLQMRHFDFEDTMRKIPPLFGRANFVILIEITQHDVVPYDRINHPELYQLGCPCNSTLMMKAKLAIIDIRTKSPCIILEEIINTNQTIPQDCELCDYHAVRWGSPNYVDTPFDIGHRRFAEVIVNRIQNVVWNAK